MWQAQSPTGTIAQVVVVGSYGLVDVTGTGSYPTYFELLVKGASGTWQPDIGRTYSSSMYGPVAACSFTQRGVPQDVADQLVANDARLAVSARQNPQAGCNN